MTIKQRGKEGICTLAFTLDGEYHVFTFDGKKGQPLITSKKEAREQKAKIKGEMRGGCSSNIAHFATLRNFTRRFS